VLLAEHRLERVVQFADSVALVAGEPRSPGRVSSGAAAEVLAVSPVAPPVVELARWAGWDPVPLSVRDARRLAAPLRERLASAALPGARRSPGENVARVSRVTAGYGPIVALRSVDVEIHRGEVVAVMGRNGSGKSTLLGLLAGQRTPAAGTVVLGDDVDPTTARAAELVRQVGFVPSRPGLLLYAQSVAEECARCDHDGGYPPGTTRRLLDRIVPDVDDAVHPRDLSEGQRLGLALAVVLAADPPLVLLDEPTRGLDYAAKRRLIEVLSALAAEGRAVVLATHDVEVVAQLADRAVVLAGGEIVADGPARDVVCHSPVFAPQVAKVLAPEPWLTVAEVADVLAEEVA
jgi:energy-coupling factor transport system ATP-binding protein